MEIKEDIQNIIDFSLNFAEQMLKTEKEFYPFGSTIDSNGELTIVGYQDNETDMPESQKVIDELTAKFERELNMGEIRAYGLTYDIVVQSDSLNEKSDAILIDIYHQKSDKIPKYYFTYSWNENDELILGDSFGMEK